MLNAVKFRFLCVLLICVSTGLANSHPGGLDDQGGHTDRKTNEYHCHKEPCFSNHKQVEQAHHEAAAAGAVMSNTYNREDWPHWIDADDDCQDTRVETLLASSRFHTKFSLINGCTVAWGIWPDPYTGKTFFNASAIDIDHVVPLAHAHRNGAANWLQEKKQQFANDPINLITVDGSSNRSKSDQGPNEWMPPREEYWCEYLKRWVVVKAKYGLTASNDETTFVNNHLIPCTK
jgi:hypothetical protein